MSDQLRLLASTRSIVQFGQLAEAICMSRSASTPPQPELCADRGFFGSRPFSRATALLEEQGAGGIDWKLP